ncbi:ABC transporter substrate-binding protein [Rhizobium paknamense]|uniref:Multiple sugar transport system substrate-binding protein n=1 Tax=Rhizobium paknamense TaxID=1206817 RepID=A0ABU0IDV8_9HYPH|nr:ABC transporter substrate-binding protein [Rhizobium paknamense]MDQ0456433.1 multiple sugar transport system substrate-binding protein [Rhizobium paknamense]
MTLTTNRRGMLLGGAATLGCFLAGRALAQSETRLRFLWWGSKERSDRTYAAINAYQAKNAGTRIEGESFGWDNYWTRLATQTAGGNAPDLIQMDYRYIFEYARRNSLLDLTPHMGKGLTIDDFGAANINSGKVDGKLYGVNLGVNSSIMLFNRTAWEEAGVEPPHDDMSWDDFTAACVKLTEAKKRRAFYGTQDGSGLEPTLECWLRQRGKALYSPSGDVAFTAADMTDWFKMWAEMRKAKACVPPDAQALDQLTIETSMVALGKAAVAFAHSNQFIGHQAISKEKLGLTSYPLTPGGKPGQYLKPSMMVSLSAQTKNPDAAVALINFLVEDPEAAKILGVERGVPASEKIRNGLTSSLSDNEQQVVAYIDRLTPKVGALPPPPPNGAGENQFMLKKIAEEVAFGKTKPEDGAAKFVEQAAANIKRG